MDADDPLAQALDAIGADRGTDERERHVANLGALLANMARYGNRRDAPVRTTPAYLGDRWSSLVMHLLSGGMLRYGELRRLIGIVSAEQDISQRMLTLKLRVLERDGLLLRQVTTDTPPRVEYSLTDLGAAVYAHFIALVRWSEQASPRIRAARERYDHLHPESVGLWAGSGPGEGPRD